MTAPDFFVDVQGGARVCLPPTLSNITTYVLLEQETWFEDELDFVRVCLGPGDCAVDVGANFGVFTTAMAAAVGGGGSVLAFEPAASTAAFLRETLSANGLTQVQAVQAALSDRPGSALLEIGDSPELNALAEAPQAGREAERVELLRLDDVMRRHGGMQLSLIKIDAEGHELQVSKGAQRTLLAHEPLVLFEIKHGPSVEYRLLDFLQTLGFEAYRLLPGPGVLVPHRRDMPLDDFQLNLFGCTPGRARALNAAGLLALPGAAPAAETADSREARDYLQTLPGPAPAAGSADAHAQALLHYALSQTPAATPEEKAAQLGQALRLARRACSEEASLARLLTLTALAAGAGERRAAVDTLATLKGMVDVGHAQLSEPCLPPHPRYAALPWRESPVEWVECAVVESFERLCAFSSVFQGPAALPSLEYLRSKRFYCAQMERRRQLLRMRSGRQPGPQPHPLLIDTAPDNLNPWFWSAGQ
ncbi:MAG TPA: FkbM family methyltransferase [Burkholderiales bacterium]|nr:FkbM family methyltransferase [Burkholderiales bacterium]